MRRWLVVPFFVFVACATPEIRLGAKSGIPKVAGSTEFTLDAFTCGNPITAGETTVNTRKVTGGCEFTFNKEIEVVRASDYARLPELQGALNLLQAVEMSITTLEFTDTDTNTKLDISTRVTSVSMSINGQVVADKAALSALPKTVSLTGQALTDLKAKVDKRVPASVTVNCVAVIPDTPAPPKKLKIDYDAQPTLVLGAGEIKLPQ